MGRQATPPAVLRDWSTTIQFRFAEALPLVTSWSCRDVAFHGGTSLNMSWGSPRYSEDLDFLLAQTNTTKLEAVMSKALKRMQAAMLLSHPDVTLEMKNKTREGGRLQHFQITASSSAYQEKCMVKVEFWPVDQDYLNHYESQFVFPVRQGEVVTRSSAPLPAGTLRSAYADKLTAFATRPFLKGRDIFDLWWIDQQQSSSLDDIAGRFTHNVRAYETTNHLAPHEALEHFLSSYSEQQIMEKADPDLKRWLPDAIWTALWPDGVRQMVTTVRERIETVAQIVRDIEQANQTEADELEGEESTQRMTTARPKG